MLRNSDLQKSTQISLGKSILHEFKLFIFPLVTATATIFLFYNDFDKPQEIDNKHITYQKIHFVGYYK